MTKFRVWDKQLGYFCVKSNIFVSADGKAIAGCETLDSKIIRYYPLTIENYVLQQFTGLLDKNGIEIYEGDIVIFSKWGCPQKSPNIEDYLTNKLKVVKYSLDIGGDYPFAGFTFINYNCADLEVGYLVDCMNVQYCQVVGNIFENQELLYANE